MNFYTVISGDVIAFTSLSETSKSNLEDGLNTLFKELNQKFDTYSRLVKGDYLECAIPQPEQGLRIALLIKTFIKMQELDAKNERHRFFEEYGIRLALGYGTLSRYDPQKEIIDGEAIYLSGRKINEESTHHQKRVTIKNTLQFVSAEPALNQPMEAVFALLDFMIIRATRKQCEVAYHKLWGRSEEEIATIIGTSQPAVNQHSTSIGWNAIEKAVNYYENALTQS